MIRRLLCLIVCLVASLLALGTLNAQTSGGTIAGTVTDPTGALVPNAQVTAKGVDTGTVYTTVSTSGGSFHFPQMQLGRYDLTIAAPGFKTQTLTGILVQTGNVSPAEVHLTMLLSCRLKTLKCRTPSPIARSSTFR